MQPLVALLLLFTAAPAEAAPPKLILTIVVDQFRADVLPRLESRFRKPVDASGQVGGFRYLMERGAYYPFAEYDVLQSMTGPGHATILTGAYPYQMGIPANDWWDHRLGRRMYCAEDRDTATVGSTPQSPNIGTSPRNLLSTTVGDELKISGRPSRVVAVAGKDRSAIFLGGKRADLVLWFDINDFRWVSSRFYLPDGKLPEWVERLNDAIQKRKGETIVFDKPSGPGTGFSMLDPMVKQDKGNAGKVGATWPHSAKLGERGAMALPFALETTEKTAMTAYDEMKLGRKGGTDMLSISFSGYDYLSHIFGSQSREMEEMSVAMDATLARVLNHVRQTMPGGLRDVLIVMTGDHGGPPNPDWLKSTRIDAGRLDDTELSKLVNERLNERFGKPDSGDWVRWSVDFNFYLNHEAMAAKKLDPEVVEEETKSVLRAVPGVAQVFGLTDFRKRRLPPGMHERQILKTYFPGRSGDVVFIPSAFYMLPGDTVSHITGYTYDRMVPLAFAGPGIRPGRRANRAEVVDIAPTLSWILGIVPPPYSEGRVLTEALKTEP